MKIMVKVKVKSFSGVRLFATPWTAASQAPPSMGFSRQKYWSIPPGHRPDLGRGVAPLGRSCAVTACHSRPLPLTSSLGVASLARACAPLQPPTLVRRDSCVSHCYLVLSKFIRWSFKFPKVLCFLQILGSFDSSLSVTVFHVFRACFLSFPFFFSKFVFIGG